MNQCFLAGLKVASDGGSESRAGHSDQGLTGPQTTLILTDPKDQTNPN